MKTDVLQQVERKYEKNCQIFIEKRKFSPLSSGVRSGGGYKFLSLGDHQKSGSDRPTWRGAKRRGDRKGKRTEASKQSRKKEKSLTVKLKLGKSQKSEQKFNKFLTSVDGRLIKKASRIRWSAITRSGHDTNVKKRTTEWLVREQSCGDCCKVPRARVFERTIGAADIGAFQLIDAVGCVAQPLEASFHQFWDFSWCSSMIPDALASSPSSVTWGSKR